MLDPVPHARTIREPRVVILHSRDALLGYPERDPEETL